MKGVLFSARFLDRFLYGVTLYLGSSVTAMLPAYPPVAVKHQQMFLVHVFGPSLVAQVIRRNRRHIQNYWAETKTNSKGLDGYFCLGRSL